jgi:hypothetical protein
MSVKYKMVDLGEGITTVKEVWLDELTKPEKVEREKEQLIQNYIRSLTEINDRREAEIEALRAQAQRLGEHAMRLQEAQALARVQAKEANYALEREFRELADQWYQETMWLSSTSEIVSKEVYYQIISLGKQIIPFILKELQERGGHWFLALRVLARANPVKPEDRGNIRKMTQAWLEWGRDHNHI